MRALTLADCLSILLLERFFLRIEQCYSKTQRPFADSSDACSKLAVCRCRDRARRRFGHVAHLYASLPAR